VAKASQLALFGAFLTTTWPQPRADRQYGVNLAALPIVKLSPVVIAWLSRKTGTTVRPSGLVSACKMDTPRAALRLGGARACFSHRIIKDHPHCPDILSLRQNRRTLASVSGRWSLLDGMNAFAIAESGMGHPLSGHAGNVDGPFRLRHAPRLPLHAPRLSLHDAGTSGVRPCADPPPLAPACYRPPNWQRPNGAQSRGVALLYAVCHRIRRLLRKN